MSTIKVHSGNTVFECETPEDAVRIHKLLNGGAGDPVTAPLQPVKQGNTGVGSTSKLVAPAKAFLKKLDNYAGQKLDVAGMVKLTGVKHQNGIGPRMAQYRRVLGEENIALDNYFTKIKPEEGGDSTWLIHRPGQAA
jgi:hypothetical protein